MNSGCAQEAIDGAMLSDANIYPSKNAGDRSRYINSFFRIQLGGNEHMDWLASLKQHLEHLGILVSPMYPKLYKRKSDDYITSWLVTRVSPLLSVERSRWYKNGKKFVPIDLELTPAVVANWMMGDGTSSYNKGVSVMSHFGTYAFSDNDVLVLRRELYKLDICTGLANYEKGSVITIKQDSIGILMKLIEPFIVPSFRYKIKYRRTI